MKKPAPQQIELSNKSLKRIQKEIDRWRKRSGVPDFEIIIESCGECLTYTITGISYK
jgi:hypothetical protein